jgi:hypothetical protein
MMIFSGGVIGVAGLESFFAQEENKTMKQERTASKRPVKGAVILDA